MNRTPDMFGGKPPRAAPRVLMHVCDAGDGEADNPIVRFNCSRCGHETDWIQCDTVTEAKAGMACPTCNNRKNDGGHHCHWPGCTKAVPPAMWGCKPHWFKLPLRLRNQIWRTYKPGQEITKTPSAEYLKAATEVQQWIKSHV